MTDTNKTRLQKKEKAPKERAFGEWEPSIPNLEWQEELPAEKAHEHIRIIETSGDWPDREIIEEFLQAFRSHHLLLQGPWNAANDPVDSEIAVLRKELDEIRSRLERVEVITQGIDEPASIDPDFEWCLTHKDLLQKYPDSFVAIDTQQSKVIISDIDQVRFIEKLSQLSPDMRKTLLRIHTSQLFQSGGF